MLAVRREQTASATIETRTPRPSRSSAVSSTHTCASTPVRITGAASSSRSRSAKPAAPHAENAVFSRAGASSRSTRSSGRTLPELRVLLDDAPALEKTAFSACGAAGFAERLRELDAAPVILTGVEAHVCVLLTALDLLGRGVRVSIVADAVCSRRTASMDLGLAQARQAGAVITSTETVVFQLLGSSDTEAFREISKLLR